MESLRDRIIAAMEANFDAAAPSLSMVDMADAVIRELGLREERVELLTRYVTDWVQDEEIPNAAAAAKFHADTSSRLSLGEDSDD